MTARQKIARTLTALLLCAVSVALRPASAAAIAETSAALLAACQTCHGRDGISEAGDVPNLAGQKLDYLMRQLEAFRSGERKNPLMAAIAGQLADDDIRALAEIWSRFPTGRAAERPAPASAAIRSRMVFPAAFPQGFVLYETTDQAPDGTFMKRYVNEQALHSLRQGEALTPGTTIIVANLSGTRDVTSYAAMQSRSGWGADVPALLRNGDWDYAMFGVDRARRVLNQAPCLACHKPQAADSFVFTIKAMRERALQRTP